MSVLDPSHEARHAVAREVRRALIAMLVGASLLLLLLVAAHQALSYGETLENEYHRRAIALANHLHFIFPVLRPGFQLPPGIAAARDPVALETGAERAFNEARGTAGELTALHKRFDSGGAFARAMARLELSVQSLDALRQRHASDREGFAQALVTTDTYLEIVALQVRRQHESALADLLARQRTALIILEVVGALVLAAVVLGTRYYVRRSLKAIDEILAIDARRSGELAESLAARGAALREKETLLKEVYHRVKNNLQVVSSLLTMQGREVRDREALRLLNESANRVRAMALVHEQLYRSADLGKISCRTFLTQLAARLSEIYAPASRGVTLTTHADDLELGLDTAIPCALVLNELIANAFVHAFADRSRGTIEATVQRLPNDRVRLAVTDDGRGLPAGFSAAASPSFGMRIVVTLARQLGGELACTSATGTTCEIIFPLQRR